MHAQIAAKGNERVPEAGPLKETLRLSHLSSDYKELHHICARAKGRQLDSVGQSTRPSPGVLLGASPAVQGDHLVPADASLADRAYLPVGPRLQPLVQAGPTRERPRRQNPELDA